MGRHAGSPSTAGGYGAHAPDPCGDVQAVGWARPARQGRRRRRAAAPVVRRDDPARHRAGPHPRQGGGDHRRRAVTAALGRGREHLRRRGGAGVATSRGRRGARRSAPGAPPSRATAAPPTSGPPLRFARAGLRRDPRTGEARTTNDGQRVRARRHIPPRDRRRAPRSAATGGSRRATTVVDCPAYLGCESVPAPYEQYGSTPVDYGNHDLAEPARRRPADRLHRHPRHRGHLGRRRSSWSRTRPTSAGTTRCGRPTATIAQHVDPKDVGWHAGNWYVNMHSIGIEHEGFAAAGRDLVHRVDVPELGGAGALPRRTSTASRSTGPTSSATTRCPGITPANVAGMHWDPGPYWDWEHYMTPARRTPIPADRHAHERRRDGRARASPTTSSRSPAATPTGRRLPGAGHELRLPAHAAVRRRRRWSPTSGCTRRVAVDHRGLRHRRPGRRGPEARGRPALG